MERTSIGSFIGGEFKSVPMPRTRPALTWNDRIKRARKRGYFTLQDKLYSSNWCTCSLGESVEWCKGNEVAMLIFGGPTLGGRQRMLEKHIRTLGIDFMWAVQGDNIERAAEIRTRIQASTRAYHGMRC